MNDITTKTTMRQLLARWAEVEPEWCKLETWPDEEACYIAAEAGNEGEPGYSQGWQRVFDTKDGYYPWNSQALMEIQWAVQQAIVARGWRFNLECYPVTGVCEGVVFLDLFHIRRAGGDPAEALLSAYLAALEASK